VKPLTKEILRPSRPSEDEGPTDYIQTKERNKKQKQKNNLFHVQIIIPGGSRRRWLSGTILTSLVLDSTRFWVRISARTPILRNITTGGDITGRLCPGAGFPAIHTSIYRVSEDNFRGTACESEWMSISVKDWGLVFHNLRLHKDNKLE
jgi:hypothetical protein